jgi:hypothetical protein
MKLLAFGLVMQILAYLLYHFYRTPQAVYTFHKSQDDLQHHHHRPLGLRRTFSMSKFLKSIIVQAGSHIRRAPRLTSAIAVRIPRRSSGEMDRRRSSEERRRSSSISSAKTSKASTLGLETIFELDEGSFA